MPSRQTSFLITNGWDKKPKAIVWWRHLSTEASSALGKCSKVVIWWHGKTSLRTPTNGVTKVSQRWSGGLGIPTKTARGSNPRSAGHFGDRRKLNVPRPDSTPDLLGPNVVLWHYRFPGHAPSPAQWTLAAMEHASCITLSLQAYHKNNFQVRVHEILSLNGGRD